MAGDAVSDKFLLGQATVMLGPMVDLFNFLPATHSIGLVKNFGITAEASYVELRQGVQNTLAYSVMNGNTVRASAEVYEYTPKNLNYSLGLDGSTVVDATATTTTTALIDGSPTPVSIVPVTSATGLAALDYIMVQQGTDDIAIVRQIVSIAALNVTVTPAIGVDIAAGATVKKMNLIQVGKLVAQPFLGAKIVGKLANDEPCILYMPKIRITKGFAVSFNVNDYGNLPFELTQHDLLAGDANATFFSGMRAALFI